MDYNLNFPENNLSKLNLKRVTESKKNNIQAWNSADNFLVTFALNNNLLKHTVCIYNDSYGFINLNLASNKTYFVTDLKSQADSVFINAENCSIKISEANIFSPLENLPEKIEFSLIKIPKSLDLFELFVKHSYENLSENGVVICSFMTKFFTKQYLSIAEKYFSEVTQSKAWKKSRLIILKGKKDIKTDLNLLNTIDSEWGQLKQYFGVFSSNHIDYATQYLINNYTLPNTAKNVLDFGSGNGILSLVLQQNNPNLNIHLVDDSFLAIESSKLNVDPKKCEFIQDYSLNNFESNFFDFVISNPPFHIGFEININLPLHMFEDVFRVLKEGGEFQLVSNNHLNYKPHLEKMFTDVKLSRSNPKYTVYTCIK